MGVTRRYWGAVGLVVALAGLSVVFGRPALLVGAGGIGGWVLAHQYAFVRTVSAHADGLEVTQSSRQETVRIDDAGEIELSVELPERARVRVAVDLRVPTGVEPTGDDPRVAVPVGERSATETFEVRYRVAGDVRFDRPEVTVTDPEGRFRTEFPSGEPLSVTVEPGGATDIRAGIRGDGMTATYGDTPTGQRGHGIDIAEIRQYVPGDDIRKIDWNATARFGTPHVLEFEGRDQLRTEVVIDCRPAMGTGPDGATKFDYARQVALSILEHARERNDTMGVTTVGDGGILDRWDCDGSDGQYGTVYRDLHSIRCQGDGNGRRSGGVESPAEARRQARILSGDDSAFAATLRPFFSSTDSYFEQFDDSPLYNAVRTLRRQSTGTVTTVLVTDDGNRTETREAVRLARRRNDHVLVYLTPSVLFEYDGIAGVETAYRRYLGFERFRRRLSRLDRVTAVEVGPGDRVETILARETNRRERAEVSR